MQYETKIHKIHIDPLFMCPFLFFRNINSLFCRRFWYRGRAAHVVLRRTLWKFVDGECWLGL